jgi:signal transduction histidine kinase/ligand-binding sensor domain-containing protein
MPGRVAPIYGMRSCQRGLALQIACILFTQTLTAQTPGISGVNVVINRISLDQAGTMHFVNAITQDRRGLIWVAKPDGLYKFDGVRFTAFDEPGNLIGRSVTAVCEDRDGFIWAGTRAGLYRVDPATRSFKKYLHDDKDTTSLDDDIVRCVFVDRSGNLWVGTKFSLNLVDRRTGTCTRFVPSPGDTIAPGKNAINRIIEDRSSTLWVACGEFLMQGGGVFKFDRARGKFSSLGPSRRTFTLFEDREGDFWVSVAGPELFKYDRASRRSARIPLPGTEWVNPDRQGIMSICEDRIGTLWMATWGWGLLRYDRIAESFTHFSPEPSNPNSISSLTLNTVFLDRAGLLWVGAEGGVVNTVATKPFLHRRVIGISFKPMGRVDIMGNDDANTLWLSCRGNGMWRFDPATQRAKCFLPGSHYGTIKMDRHGTVWFRSPSTLFKHDPVADTMKVVWRMPSHHGETKELTSMFIDNAGSFWMGGNSILVNLMPDLKTYSVFVHDPRDTSTLPSGPIGSGAQDRHGNLWFAAERGVCRYEKATRSFTKFRHDDRDTTTLSDDGGTTLYVDRNGTLWVTTFDGLNRFNESRSSFTRFYVSDPRVNWRGVGRIQEDAKGNFWYFIGKWMTMFEPSTGKFMVFDRSDGLEDVEILHWSHTRLKSGELVFGTMDGILVFHPDSVRKDTYIPPVVFNGIWRGTRRFKLTTSADMLREFSFDHEEKFFTISFAALSYDMPEFNQYAYKLEGFDKDWAYVGNRREATYTNLDPGEYIFRVKGSNHDGVWNETGASLAILVRPAFWQTWWFKLLAAVAFVGLFAFIYEREVTRLRREKWIQQEFSQQQIESQEAERKRLAAELHDGLGQDLLVVNNELQQFLREGIGSKGDLRQAAALVQESIQSVREISSNLHPHHLDRLGFCAAVEAMTENISRSTGLTIQRSCDDIDRLLPKETEIHMYRIIQEALSNVVRHASAKNVNVQVKKNSETVEITVIDDGKGFNVNEALERRPPLPSGGGLHGFGLSSMTERVRIVGGTIKIESTPGTGTAVHVSVPYS